MRPVSKEHFDQELARIIDSLRSYEPLRIILFGSFARGDYHALSDVDLLIVKDTDRHFFDRIGDVLRLCDTALSVEPLVYTPAELVRMEDEGNSFLEEVFEEGVVVYEQQPA